MHPIIEVHRLKRDAEDAERFVMFDRSQPHTVRTYTEKLEQCLLDLHMRIRRLEEGKK
jgi:hypothetical protein